VCSGFLKNVTTCTFIKILKMINYNGKQFRVIQNTANGETNTNMIFSYQQKGNVVSCLYSGEAIIQGHLLGLVDANGVITMRYHQVNTNGGLMTGKCISTPEILNNGKIRLHEKWQWTSGDCSKGVSVLDEI
jgi:NADPH:quinone reductase-like Zn-dependent oxidoreductase